ncbi:basic helix-loop-helix (bHLH) DNA-binding superfamily protein [Rhynchospora pubera]|uniref:Basic helix-loop-helix (BHLH) DNA-binding superfamily protein n=1 Tax=Rhynchospora pubera TaxID=906938 RepID=A0AAV8DVC8_9POAL|nr:basic helix-loop-helix (bHLH) DNA-binding superfamily protein [Rhynchospora pubera]
MEESNVDSWFINFEPDVPYFLQDFEHLDQSAPSPMILDLSSPSPECCWSNSNLDPNLSPEVCATSPPLQLPNAVTVTDQTKKKRKLPRKKSWNSRIAKEKNSTDGQEIEKSDGSDDIINLSPTTGRGRKRSSEAKSNGARGKNDTGPADQVPQLGLHKKDHVIAERMRREKLTQRFIALSSLLPGLSRMDKASVLEDAIKYVKQLQERVKTLEAQTLTKSIQPSNSETKSQSTLDECNSAESTVDDDQSTNKKFIPEIEVRISQQRILIKIHCGNQQGILAKLLSEIENLGLTIVTTSAVPFTSSSINITVSTKACHYESPPPLVYILCCTCFFGLRKHPSLV